MDALLAEDREGEERGDDRPLLLAGSAEIKGGRGDEQALLLAGPERVSLPPSTFSVATEDNQGLSPLLPPVDETGPVLSVGPSDLASGAREGGGVHSPVPATGGAHEGGLAACERDATRALVSDPTESESSALVIFGLSVHLWSPLRSACCATTLSKVGGWVCRVGCSTSTGRRWARVKPRTPPCQP